MSKVGRKPFSELDKAKARVSNSYRKYKQLINKTASDALEERMQFCDSRTQMGRPGIPLTVQRDRALKVYKDAYAQYCEIAAAIGGEPEPEEELIKIKSQSPGRPAVGKLERLMRYVRRNERVIDDLMNTEELGLTDHKFGRKPKSNLEKIQMYKNRINGALIEAESILATMHRHEITKQKINELSIKRRRYNVFLNIPGHIQNKSLDLDPFSEEDIKVAIAKRDELTVQIEKFEQLYAQQHAKFKLEQAEVEKESHFVEQLQRQNALLMEALRMVGIDPDEVLNSKKPYAGTVCVDKGFINQRTQVKRNKANSK